MTRDWNRPPLEPTPDQLAAYFDGALAGPAHAAIESWLADHPEVQSTDHDDELARACQATQPADPSTEAWSRVLDHVAAAIPSPTAAPLHRRRVGLIIGTLAAAAAAVAGVFLGRALWPTKKQEPKTEPEVVFKEPEKKAPGDEGEESSQEVFPLPAPGEVRVLAMDGDDTHVEIYGQMVNTLVMCEPPVADALLLPTSFERTRIVGWIDPALHFEDWDVPMIVDPEVLAKDWRP